MAGSNPEQFTTTGWPWRTGNSVELLDGGAEFFPAMLAAIDGARSSVLLEMYLVRSGRVLTGFIDSLTAAVRRGVRVCVVFDAFGSLGLSRADRRRLLEGGVELRFFNPLALAERLGNLLRDHRKLLLTDGRTAFVGGTGLTDDFAPGPRGPWREVMVRIQGPRTGSAPSRAPGGAVARSSTCRCRRRASRRPAPPDDCRCRKRASARCSPMAFCAASTAARSAPGS